MRQYKNLHSPGGNTLCCPHPANSDNYTIEDTQFLNCEFDSGLRLVSYTVQNRTTARNVSLTKCRIPTFGGIGAVLDTVTIDQLRISARPATLDACAFRHVTITGNCGSVIFNRDFDIMDPEKSAAFNQANDDFHATVDWALDLRGLQASAFELRGAIPVDLIRRDPEQQIIMSRDIALSEEWCKYGPPKTFEVATFIDSAAKYNLFVACSRSKYFAAEMEFFDKLRAAGLVT